MSGRRRIISASDDTPPLAIAGRISVIRPKCHRSFRTGFSRSIYKLYLHYCYLLGYLPKHTDYKPTSPYLKEDLRKLDELSQQVRYMSKYGIETLDDLYADREKIQRDMDPV